MPATSNRASIKLYNVTGMGRMSGNTERDNSGCTFLQQFWNEIVDNAVDCYYWTDGATEEKAVKGAWRSCIEHCAQCGRRINGDAWVNLDMGGEPVCDSHVKIVTRAE